MTTLATVADLLKAIDVAAHEGEVPEDWVAPVEQAFAATGTVARADLSADLDRLAVAWREDQRLQARADDLRLVVRQHYRSRLGADAARVFWAVPRRVRVAWQDAGLLGPVTGRPPLESHLAEMAEAARVGELLRRDTSYAAMRSMARDARPAPTEALALQIAVETLAQAIDNLAGRDGTALADLVADDRRRALIARLGTTAATRLGRRSLDRLAREMAGLLGGVDRSRDWERAGVTTVNYAYNLATLARLVARNARYIGYDIHPDACASCYRLFRHRDGSVRVFPRDEIWRNVAETGGLNVGLKARLIGQPGGWVPGANVHPWCRCKCRRATRVEVTHSLAQPDRDPA